MADTFKFELVSPERLLVSEEVSQVIIPGTEGEMTVMAEHAPVMTTIRPGVVTVTRESGQTDGYVVFGGFADILPSGCTLLAESAMHVDETNRDHIRERVDAARKEMEETDSEERKHTLTQYLDELSTLEGTIMPG